MAASFPESSQCKYWLQSKPACEATNAADRCYLSREELKNVGIHFVELLIKLGTKLKMRQRVISTAVVYLKRFYLKNGYIEFDPFLIFPTCLYVAAKVEECVVAATTFACACKKILTDYQYTSGDILECEFYLLEELDFYTVVHHAYRPLPLLIASKASLQPLFEPAWNIINDAYRCDVVLRFHPHTIALAAIYIAGYTHDNTDSTLNIRQWLAELNVDLAKIKNVTKEILDLYERWSHQDKADTHAIIVKIRRRRSASSNPSSPALDARMSGTHAILKSSPSLLSASSSSSSLSTVNSSSSSSKSSSSSSSSSSGRG
eukprot:TRINITY_DN4455_c0_g1_i1.p1 TRINITY_DN4455_c0_g1~~TRINITY_DN4455_c0_g1_i1.p1  ORF type:complete len:318 (-),score=105.66 TRINITY_DN4455_c0_g1_i1:190-1143(-)